MSKSEIGLVAGVLLFLLYVTVGVGGNAEAIHARAQVEIPEIGWNIVRYEGHEWSSFGKHGGYCWYTVEEKSNPRIRYRVQVTLWAGELQYHYGSPEEMSRIDVVYVDEGGDGYE